MFRIFTFHDQPLQSHWLQKRGQHNGCVSLQQTANGLTLCFCCRLSTARKSLAEMPALQIRCFSTSHDSSSSWSCRNWKKLRASSSRTRRALLLSTRLQQRSRKTSDNDRQSNPKSKQLTLWATTTHIHLICFVKAVKSKMLGRMQRFSIGNIKTVNQAAWMGYSIKLYLLFCMNFSTRFNNYGDRYSSHWNLSKTRSWGDRTIHRITIFFYTEAH